MRKLLAPALIMVLVLLFVPGVAQSTQTIAHKVSNGLHSAGNGVHQFLQALS
jgi:competence protein ComGC